MLTKPRSLPLLLGLLLALLLAGPALAATKSHKATPEEVRADVAKTLKDLGHYSARQRDAAVTAAKKAMAKTDVAIDQVETKMEKDWDSMDAAARRNARATLKALQQERNDLSEWYGGMKHSSAGAWESIKKGFAKSYKTLEKTLEKAAAKFKE